MLDLLGWLFLTLLALDAAAWVLVLTVAGIVGLVKRLFRALAPYR